MQNLVFLRLFDRSSEASRYQDALQERGIFSVIEPLEYDDDAPLDAPELGRCALKCLPSDSDEALQLLQTLDFSTEITLATAEQTSNLVLLKKMTYLQEAAVYKARLEAEGVRCFLVDKNATNPLPMLGFNADMIELYVLENDQILAQEIARRLDGSTPAVNRSIERKIFFWGVIAVLLVLAVLTVYYAPVIF